MSPDKTLTDSANMSAAATLERQLREHSATYSPEWGKGPRPILADHLPMALFALKALGGSSAHLVTFGRISLPSSGRARTITTSSSRIPAMKSSTCTAIPSFIRSPIILRLISSSMPRAAPGKVCRPCYSLGAL